MCHRKGIEAAHVHEGGSKCHLGGLFPWEDRDCKGSSRQRDRQVDNPMCAATNGAEPAAKRAKTAAKPAAIVLVGPLPALQQRKI